MCSPFKLVCPHFLPVASGTHFGAHAHIFFFVSGLQASPNVFHESVKRALDGSDAMYDVSNMSQYDATWTVVGALLLASGSPSPLSAGVPTVDVRTSEALVCVSRDTKASLSEVVPHAIACAAVLWG